MKQDKVLLKEEIKKGISSAESLLILRYRSLKANLANGFRSQLHATDAKFEVVPKRLLVKAAEELDISLNLDELEGHIAVIYAQGDMVGVTKCALEYSKENGELLELLGGRSQGVFYSADQVIALSKLPSLNEMRAQLLATFVAPMTQSLSVMKSLLTSVMYCLQNKIDKETSN